MDDIFCLTKEQAINIYNGSFLAHFLERRLDDLDDSLRDLSPYDRLQVAIRFLVITFSEFWIARAEDEGDVAQEDISEALTTLKLNLEPPIRAALRLGLDWGD